MAAISNREAGAKAAAEQRVRTPRFADRLLRQLARGVGVPLMQAVRRPAVRHSMRRLARLFPSDFERMPPDAIVATGDWAAAHLESGRFQRDVHAAQQVVRPLPKSVDPEPHWKFRRACTGELPATFAASIPGGRIVGREGFTLTPDGCILKEVSREWFVTPEQHSLFFKLRLPPARKLPGRTVNLAFVSGHNYYHWLFDVLARLAVIEKAGFGTPDHFVTNHAEAPFQRETLDALGIPLHNRIATGAGAQFVCEELLLPSPQGVPGQTPAWACQFLRDKFLPPQPVENAPQRVYISRQGAAYRRILNPTVLDPLLDEFGFTTVTLESLRFEEQVRTFAGAGLILAPHGAGMANLVFCRPGAKIIELFAPNYVNECFWTLACRMQLDYHYIIGQGARPDDCEDPHRVEDNIVVDSEIVRSTLKLAGL